MIDEILLKFPPISLAEMSEVKLMNRTDTKFVTNKRKLESLLALAADQYYVQEIDGCREAEYSTLYFDTKENSMYMVHQNGKKARQKLRIRSYVASDEHFLEVKTKNNRGRTSKKREQIISTETPLADHYPFLKKLLWVEPEYVVPKQKNHFNRITLVNIDKTERLTIDYNLSFYHLETKHAVNYDDIVIIELKRDGLQPSPILPLLRQLRIFPMGFSKYCIGMALTNPLLKQNCLKERIKKINKILNSK